MTMLLLVVAAALCGLLVILVRTATARVLFVLAVIVWVSLAVRLLLLSRS